jgi:hypothetical protein
MRDLAPRLNLGAPTSRDRGRIDAAACIPSGPVMTTGDPARADAQRQRRAAFRSRINIAGTEVIEQRAS